VFQGAASAKSADWTWSCRQIELEIGKTPMPRIRKPSAFPTQPIHSPELRLAPVSAMPATDRASGDPLRFFRVMAEIERLRGLPAHPESPTRH
jgi:hypothetical protein